MKERGMIFNAEMVRAILSGNKTQTRRPIKEQPELTENSGFSYKGRVFGSGSNERETNRNFAHVACPHGKPGDRIWVRETFQGPLVDFVHSDDLLRNPEKYEKPENCVYKADGTRCPEFYDADDNLRCCWRPSIHMPRWASRILLEITNVRVERLNDISEADARTEGVPPAGTLLPEYPDTYLTPKGDFATATVAFQRLWESIYGEES